MAIFCPCNLFKYNNLQRPLPPNSTQNATQFHPKRHPIPPKPGAGRLLPGEKLHSFPGICCPSVPDLADDPNAQPRPGVLLIAERCPFSLSSLSVRDVLSVKNAPFLTLCSCFVPAFSPLFSLFARCSLVVRSRSSLGVRGYFLTAFSRLRSRCSLAGPSLFVAIFSRLALFARSLLGAFFRASLVLRPSIVPWCLWW